MSQPSAAAAGTFTIGRDLTINRLGFGAMRLTGRGIWGEPEDREECLRVLKRLPDVGINFVDTADSYGPFVSETLIAEALHPYHGMLIATKGGLTRSGPNQWEALGRPEYLRQCVLMSLRRLKVDRIDLWQLHRIDPKVPRDEQFGVVGDMMKEGLLRHAGLSNVKVDDVQAAQKVFPVVTVQNRYNLADRKDEALVDYCEAHDIGFIPWFPLAAGDLAKPGGIADRIANAHGATGSQVALAWMLMRSRVILPIPGTSKVSHLEENVTGAALKLSDAEFAALDKASPAPRAKAA
jgi:aryl-alcohol dehydrogenase-like predicted oxidoreductase